MSQPNQKRRNVLQRQGYKYHLSEEDILKAAYQHETYVAGGWTFEDLPRFDDVSNCGISQDQTKALLQLEVKRLVKAALTTEPLLFDGYNGSESLDAESFKTIAQLADEILCNYAIIDHENQLVIFENCKDSALLKLAALQFKHSHGILTRAYQQSNGSSAKLKVQKATASNLEAYFALVDYATAFLARWLIRSAEGKRWKSQSIAVLAQQAMKLKALSHDPSRYAVQTLANGDDLLRRLKVETRDEEHPRAIQIVDTNAQTSEVQITNVALHDEPELSYMYMVSMASIRSGISRFFRSIVGTVYTSTISGKHPEDFEICTLVYETGFQRSLTVLSESREGNLTASSETSRVKNAYTSLKLAHENVKAVQARQTPPPAHSSFKDQTKITWNWSEGRHTGVSQDKTIGIHNMQDLISVIFPLSLVSSSVGASLETMMQFTSLRSSDSAGSASDVTIPFNSQHFQAKFSMSTGAFLARKQQLKSQDQGMYLDPDVSSMAECALVRQFQGISYPIT